jgi:N-hydroxyarylamine O-acetyltransferase
MTTGIAPSFDWRIEQFDLQAYLRRIDRPAEPPSSAALRRLTRAHVLAVPFENVDVVRGQHRGLSPEAITAKLVHRARGGYCYEHGLLFAAIAEQLGYRVTRLSSRTQPHKTGARTHMSLLVHVDATAHLVDVGYGASMIEPMPLHDGVEIDQAGWMHRLDEQDGLWTLSKWADGDWAPLHAFTTEPQRPIDYEVEHHYVSTHPKSPFTGQVVVMRLAEGVSRRLIGDQLTVEHADGRTETTTVAPEELGTRLRELDVELTEPELAEVLGRRWRTA